MPDYTGNSKKQREAESRPPKNVERVVATEVIVQRKGVLRKFRDLFIEADLKTVVRYVASDVLLPAARNLLVDATNKGIERMVYGEAAVRRRNFGSGPRITYNSPVSRGYGGSPLRSAPPVSVEPRSATTGRYNRNEFILTSREEGELVLERMNDIIDTYEVVSVADLNDLIGLPTSHVDNKWGWTNLSATQIRQVREGYLVDFPPAEPIA